MTGLGINGGRRQRKLPMLFGLLVVASVLISFQGTQWSTVVMTDGQSGSYVTSGVEQQAIAPIEQEAALLRTSNRPQRNTAGIGSSVAFEPRAPAKEKEKLSLHNVKSGAAAPADRESTFSACLLIKDDNDILNEWVAYHYHVLNLRYMIVAIDPFSETSPSSALNQWLQTPFNMTIIEWRDVDYMPHYFLEGKFDQVPSFLPVFVKENPIESIWHQHLLNESESLNFNKSSLQDMIEADLIQINNHRFRQATFVSHCFQTLRSLGRKWVLHIDTDEYVVINPRLRIRPKAVKGVTVPEIPTAGSIVTFLYDMYTYYPKRLLKSCLMMPTILFGATENDNSTLLAKVPSGWNRSRFESLRWTYHADLQKGIANGLQKAVVDVSTLSPNHPIFVTHLIKSVHQPLDSSYDHWKDNLTGFSTGNGATFRAQICRQMTLKPDVDAVRLFPLTTNHYVGSFERYTARQDLRRNLDIYMKKANVQGGIDDGWIQGWLADFVAVHGLEASRQILGDYYLDTKIAVQ